MSRLIKRSVKAVFVAGVLGALAFGAQAALAGDRALDCICDPEDPDRNEFCEDCCMSTGSICPLGGGTEPRECLCV